jgi:predicted small lipoprotein YifL
MKKIIALLMLAALTLSAAACGAKTPADTTTETTAEVVTDPAVTEPEVGRIGEKSTFYVYVPEHWCKMEYTKDDTRLRLFDIPSAPKIEEGKTAEVEIKVAAQAGTKGEVDAAVAGLMKIEGAKKGKDAKLGGETFTVVTYTDPKEKRAFTAYVGLGGGSLASITLKGIKADDEDAAAILRSISFKSMEQRKATTTTTTTKPETTAAKTTKAAGETTTAAAKTTTAAAKTTTAAAKTTTAAVKTTTAAVKTTKASA